MSENWECSGGKTGYVYLSGSQLPPPHSKWEEVVLPKGTLQIRSTAISWEDGSKHVRRKWVDLEKGDLFRLNYDLQFRPLYRLCGPAIAGCRPCMSASTNYNAMKAFCCRVMRRPAPPAPGIWRWIRKFVALLLPEHNTPPREMTIEEWLDSMPSDRKVPLRKAFELYKRTGWVKKYAEFHSFIKLELLPFFSKDELGIVPLTDMVDRLINAPHDVTHVIAGPRIKPYTAWLKKQWHHENFIFYGSTTPQKLQLWLDAVVESGNNLVFWSDYTMFDTSHNCATWDFMERFYNQHKHCEDFQKVLRAWRLPVGTLKDFKYRVLDPFNASGRDDTALANAILNGFAMVLSVSASWYGVALQDVQLHHILDIATHLRLSVCGDDALGFLPFRGIAHAEKFVETTRENIAKFGFKAKMFWSDRLEDAVYLGHRPLPFNGKWYWTKTIGRCLYKLGWQSAIKGDASAYFRGICEMHSVISPHVPIISDICKSWLAATDGAKTTKFVFDENKPWQRMGEVNPGRYFPDTLDACARAYTVRKYKGGYFENESHVTARQLTADAIRDCISYIRAQINGEPCVLDHWVLRHMVLVDEL